MAPPLRARAAPKAAAGPGSPRDPRRRRRTLTPRSADPGGLMTPPDPEALVAAWCDLDRRAAVAEADREIVDASGPVRAVIAGFALAGGSDEEIYDACAALGRLIAQRGGSPTLAAVTIDHAGDALGVRPAAWLGPGRAAVAEGFTRALLERRAAGRAAKLGRFPRCAVALPGDVIAIAAGLPSDDPETARRVGGARRQGRCAPGRPASLRRGPGAARAAVEDALDVVGIELATAGVRGLESGPPASRISKELPAPDRTRPARGRRRSFE